MGSDSQIMGYDFMNRDPQVGSVQLHNFILFFINLELYYNL